MKIRALTYGLSLCASDFAVENHDALRARFDAVTKNIESISAKLVADSYEVQTVRLSLNRIEDWLVLSTIETQLSLLSELLEKCSRVCIVALGCCTTQAYIEVVPKLLAFNQKFSCSALIPSSADDGAYTLPDTSICVAAARACLQLSTVGDCENFRFCIGFNVAEGTPFFPVSYYHRYVLLCVLLLHSCMLTELIVAIMHMQMESLLDWRMVISCS